MDYLDSFQIRNRRVRYNNFLKNRTNQKLFVLARHRKRIVERSFSDQSYLQFPVTPSGSFAATIIHFHLVLVSTERFFVSRYQVELSSGRWFIAIVTHVTARSAHAVRTARKTLATKKTVVSIVAWKRWKSALWAYRVSEQLVGPSMVTQGSTLDSACCNVNIFTLV